MIKNLTCIICPIGCNIEVEIKKGEIVSIKGYSCKRGEEYAKSECKNPLRTITTTVFTIDGKVLPVKTDKPVPKEKLFDCMKAIKSTKVSLPIEIGKVIIENIEGTGSNVISTNNMR
ncbi:MAG TPA: DUF1667 domain-containing protein [Clostridiaceae bacterium]|nr:DUF1667 domain-containing protein [Clostridiaceae bacterium]